MKLKDCRKCGVRFISDGPRVCKRCSWAFGALATLYEECKAPGWDGYGAEPVSAQTRANAAKFLCGLPRGLPCPDLGAEPDGSITVEWHDLGNNLLSLSISEDGQVIGALCLAEGEACQTNP